MSPRRIDTHAGSTVRISFEQANQAGILDSSFVRSNYDEQESATDLNLSNSSTEVLKDIGPVTAKALRQLGIDNVRHLLTAEESTLSLLSRENRQTVLEVRSVLTRCREGGEEAALSPRAALQLVKKSRAFHTLSNKQQRRLQTLVMGEANVLSAAARKILAQLETPLAQYPLKEQKSILGSLIDDSVRKADLTNKPTTSPTDKAEVACKISKPKVEPYFKFADAKIPAFRYTVTIEGHSLEIVLPHPAYRGRDLIFPEVEELAEVVAGLPKVSRDQIKRLQVNPFQNASDEYWTETVTAPAAEVELADGKLKQPTTMWTDESGIIGVFVKPLKMSKNFLRNTLLHETTHVWSMREWGYYLTDSENWSDWQKAIKKDGIAVSEYAGTDPYEDIAETAVVYLNSLGSAEHDEFARIFPQRFELLKRAISKLGD